MKKACLVRDIPSEAPERARTEISKNGHARLAHNKAWIQNTHGAQSCAATFFASVLKISGFRSKQKMRLRTFDGGGAFSSSADIKDQIVGMWLTPHASDSRIIANYQASASKRKRKAERHDILQYVRKG